MEGRSTKRGLLRSRVSIGAVRSEESRLAILTAADLVLQRDGFHGFSIEAVAREARASKPTIYRWWGDKLTLMLEVYLARTPVAAKLPETGSLRLDLIAMLSQLWNVIWGDEGNAEVSRTLLSRAIVDEKIRLAYRDEYLKSRSEPYLAVFQAAKLRGEIPDGANFELCWDIILSYCLHRLVMQRPLAAVEIEDFVDCLIAEKLKQKLA